MNFAKQLEALLCQKQRTSSRFFTAFLKYALNLEHLGKKDEYPSLGISKFNDPEKRGYLNV